MQQINSIDYLSRKSTFKQVSPSFPVTQEIPDAEDPTVFEARKHQMVAELLHKAKEMEYLIASLPDPLPENPIGGGSQPNGHTSMNGSAQNDAGTTWEGDTIDDPELLELERELEATNEEYLNLLKNAEHTRDALNDTIRLMLDQHREASQSLLNG